MPATLHLSTIKVRLPFFKRLFCKPVKLLFDHPMHETMRLFGEIFGTSRMLTQVQFESECQ